MKPLALALFTVAALFAAPTPPGAQPAPPRLALPIDCEPGKTCEVQHYVDRDPGPGTRDYRCGLQTYEGHSGIDIRLLDMAAQRRGVAVLAAAPGRVARLRDGVAERTIGQPGASEISAEACGNAVVLDHGGGWETQYCHMARGSVAVKVGDAVVAGTPLGKVGLSGKTEFPHVHMTVRRGQTVVDPFAPNAGEARTCAAQQSLWTPQAQARMPYKAGAILRAGFSAAQVSDRDVENAAVQPFTAASPWMIAYVRAIALQPGDVIELDLKGPDGVSLAKSRRAPFERWRAQDTYLVGKRRPPAGWPPGRYVAEYTVWRQGKAALSRRFEVRL